MRDNDYDDDDDRHLDYFVRYGSVTVLFWKYFLFSSLFVIFIYMHEYGPIIILIKLKRKLSRY